MSEEQDDKFLSWLRDKFFKGHPVQDRTQNKTVTKEARRWGRCHGTYDVIEAEDRHTSVVDGVLNIVRHDFKPGFMVAHEIGHVIRATDEELFKHNLGMPSLNNAGKGTPAEGWTEAYVIAAQLVIQQRHGSLPVETLERMLQVGGSGFGHLIDQKEGPKLWREEVKRLMKTLTYRKLRQEWFRKLRLIEKANQLKTAEKVAA